MKGYIDTKRGLISWVGCRASLAGARPYRFGSMIRVEPGPFTGPLLSRLIGLDLGPDFRFPFGGRTTRNGFRLRHPGWSSLIYAPYLEPEPLVRVPGPILADNLPKIDQN
jgi:hypothetical protein